MPRTNGSHQSLNVTDLGPPVLNVCSSDFPGPPNHGHQPSLLCTLSHLNSPAVHWPPHTAWPMPLYMYTCFESLCDCRIVPETIFMQRLKCCQYNLINYLLKRNMYCKQNYFLLFPRYARLAHLWPMK